MNSVSISLLIPCYNAERWIGQAIESALLQTYPDKEVIVADDGSTDRSLQIIKTFGDSIRYETGPNRGGNVTRNRLLELSSGDYVQYLDADDYLLPNKIENQVSALMPDTDVLFSPSMIEYHQGDKVSTKILPIPEPYDPFILLARWYLPQTGSPLWRRQAILDVGGWKNDQPVCQEHELYLRLVMGSKKFKYFSKAESVYRQWSDGTLWKKDQSFTRNHRMVIEDRLEHHLQEKQLMTPERQWAINMARFETARMEWLVNRGSAMNIISKINNQFGRFHPYGASAPFRYRLLYRLFGFSIAERMAQIMRKI
jgi:glycosyltransferase involved in cell wall biosynthesis